MKTKWGRVFTRVITNKARKFEEPVSCIYALLLKWLANVLDQSTKPG